MAADRAEIGRRSKALAVQVRSVRGVADILPSEVGVWQAVERVARSMFEAFGYREIRTPAFEQTTLFARGIGEETDIVAKEMYTFTDRKGQSLSLRPEGTASVVRAYLQHNLQMEPWGDKLYYIGPMFRYERPQAGRSRQFHQIGAECFGPSGAEVDAEQVILLYHLFRRLWGIGEEELKISDSAKIETVDGAESVSSEATGGGSEGTLRIPFEIDINTLGCKACRPAYRDALRGHLNTFAAQLCEDCQKRLHVNTLRVLDCKNPGCKEALKEAPMILDFICQECDSHFKGFLGLLEGAGVPYRKNPQLVRGLDYYTRTTFEVTTSLVGAQNAIAGGGRYDDLVEEFGGPPTPACGFAVGMERLIIALKDACAGGNSSCAPFVFFVPLGDNARSKAFLLMNSLRVKGVPAGMDYGGRSLKAQMRQADRQGALYCLIMGEDEMSKGIASLKDMISGEQEDLPLERAIDSLYQRHEKG